MRKNKATKTEKKKMKNCIAVYSAWTTGGDESMKVFDHPLPLDNEGTVARMLESFKKSKISTPAILFPSSTDSRVVAHLRKLVKPYQDAMDIHIFDSDDLNNIVKTLKKNGFPKGFDNVWNIGNYGRYRNWMLLYGAFMGVDNVITIDDDELIEKKNYIEDVCEEFIGTKFKGIEIWGKGGIYIDADGKKYVDEQDKTIAEYSNWPKNRVLNQSMKDQVEAPGGRLVFCNAALGGNMITNRKMFLKVPYDINITRGEDDDYTMNAEYLGFTYFFDKEMVVRHLPPPRESLFWTRMGQDIKRFKYLREKVRIFKMDLGKMSVMYKYFLRDDLEYNAVCGSIDAAKRFLDKNQREEADGFLQNALVAAKPDRHTMANLVENQMRFMEAWGKVLPKVEGLWADKKKKLRHSGFS